MPNLDDSKLLLGIAEALESRGYAHMTNGDDIGQLLDELQTLRERAVDLSRIPDGWYLLRLQEKHEHKFNREDGWTSKREGWVCELQRLPNGGSMVSSFDAYNGNGRLGYKATAQEAIDAAIKEVEDGTKNKRWIWCK